MDYGIYYDMDSTRNGEAGIYNIMLIKNQADLDAFKKMYGIDVEIEKEY